MRPGDRDVFTGPNVDVLVARPGAHQKDRGVGEVVDMQELAARGRETVEIWGRQVKDEPTFEADDLCNQLGEFGERAYRLSILTTDAGSSVERWPVSQPESRESPVIIGAIK